MYNLVKTATLYGIQCRFVLVEADVSSGMPVFDMIGYLGAEVKEAKERVRTAMKNSGYLLPAKRITVNFSPANIKKSGSMFDLAIACAVMECLDLMQVPIDEDTLVIGELGIDGSVRRVQGILPIVASAKEAGIKRLILPFANAKEASVVSGIEIIAIRNLGELVDLQNKKVDATIFHPPIYIEETEAFFSDYEENDFAFVSGQENIRRACEVAASGMHNMMMVGPPGSGKSMIAKCMAGILPDLDSRESMELSKIYSVAGLLDEKKQYVRKRPFRSPHHTITPNSLLGGGSIPKPGEITLAHGGILFLDELPEFKRSTLELLRQPLEEKQVHIDRVLASFVYPADFQLVAAMNPCPCGFYPDLNRCNCSTAQIASYVGKISGPFLDRIDICVDAPVISYDELTVKKENECSAQIRKRVCRAHEIQRERYQKETYHYNSALDSDGIRKYCALKPELEDFMKESYEYLQLSVRGYFKILKTARTIADLAESEEIRMEDLLEAVSYRELSRDYGR